jgi:hypothetical protein
MLFRHPEVDLCWQEPMAVNRESLEKLGRFLLRGLRIGASTVAVDVACRKPPAPACPRPLPSRVGVGRGLKAASPSHRPTCLSPNGQLHCC